MPPKRKQTGDTASAPAAKKVNGTARAAPAKAKAKTPSTNANSTKASMASTSGSTTSTVASPAVTPVATTTVSPPPSVYTGKFDLYSTRLSFLMSEYLPKGTSKPRHEAVYKKILTFQAKDDFSARIALVESKPASGMFHTVVITNPFSEEAIEEPVYTTGGKTQDVIFNAGEGAHASAEGAANKAPGYAASLDFEGDDTHGCIGVEGESGSIELRKVWEKFEDGERKELFEGYWPVKVQHGAMLRRKGHGSSNTFNTPFWAIRARKDEDGREIGIDAGDGTHTSRSSGLDFLDDGDDGGFDEYGESDGDSDEDEFSDDYGRSSRFGLSWDMYSNGGGRRSRYGCY